MENNATFRRRIVVGIALAMLVAPACVDARETRKVRWAGYDWRVRHTYGPSNPGRNVWSDSHRSVRVTADRKLELRIIKGRAAEVIGPPLGYGSYNWRVRSDLTDFDLWRVVGLFVWVPNGNEQDVEFARWGVPDSPTGWVVSWTKGRRVGYTNFSVTPTAPYRVRMTWTPIFARYTVTDAHGAKLVDVSYSQMRAPDLRRRPFRPRMNNWLWPGVRGVRLSRKHRRSWHPALKLDSFHFTPDR